MAQEHNDGSLFWSLLSLHEWVSQGPSNLCFPMVGFFLGGKDFGFDHSSGIALERTRTNMMNDVPTECVCGNRESMWRTRLWRCCLWEISILRMEPKEADLADDRQGPCMTFVDFV